jgi:hypothetical protein
MDGAHELFDGACLTVFSASNYCGLMGNDGAVLEVVAPGEHHVRTFPPLQWLQRSAVQFAAPHVGIREPNQPRDMGAVPHRCLGSPRPSLGRRPSIPGYESLGNFPKLEALSPLVPSSDPFPAAQAPTPQVKVLRPSSSMPRGRGAARRHSMIVNVK